MIIPWPSVAWEIWNSETATSVYNHQELREVKFLNHSLSPAEAIQSRTWACRSIYIHIEPGIFSPQV